MNCKLNLLTILSLSFTLLTFVACDKTNGLEVRTAEFSVNHDSIYLTNSVVFTANDSLGGNEYSWDFGDGNTETGKYNVTHTYEKGGIYLASMTINGFKSSRVITVYALSSSTNCPLTTASTNLPSLVIINFALDDIPEPPILA